MSKVIKNPSRKKEAITLGDSAVHKSPAHKSTPRISTEEALNFKGKIDSSIDNYISRIEKSKIDKVLKDRYESGFNDGLEDEHAKREEFIDKHFSDTIRVIESLLADAKEKKRNAFRNTEEKLISLAVYIAEQIIRKSIDADPSIVETVVSEVMEHMLSSEKVILKVSAQDYKLISSRYDKWYAMAGNVNEFKIEIDKRLSPGDCLIDTDGGIIDGFISSRLNVIADELLKINK